MAQETYSFASLDSDVDEDRNAQTRYAPMQNMLSAAHLVRTLLTAQQHRAGTKATTLTKATDPKRCYGILVEGVLKTFVKTGPPWDACAEQHTIEVDIKQAGFRKSPRNIHDKVESIGPFDLFGESLHFNVLNIPSMMRIKIECCLTRAEQRDFSDVKWMIRQHTPQILQALQDGIVSDEDLLEVLEHVQVGDEAETFELKHALALA
ncbi:hypothetical protein Slin15195_G058010 [Septoria linicola]|uniref:Uncharacterized protein n=1 Tax=Septoria linicola TaxID=215465 RepID=A0A9Q9AV01_9PEZI|nr:hypothetical protein Slin14017_G073860 [Septoria linicola]USW52482.1 hypothetical protein Slin15195_G058010 [Septoria linicola]